MGARVEGDETGTSAVHNTVTYVYPRHFLDLPKREGNGHVTMPPPGAPTADFFLLLFSFRLSLHPLPLTVAPHTHSPLVGRQHLNVCLTARAARRGDDDAAEARASKPNVLASCRTAVCVRSSSLAFIPCHIVRRLPSLLASLL